MARMFTPDPLEQVTPPETVANNDKPAIEETPAVSAESGEFEYVLGRRQVASVGLVVLTGMGAFTAMAYMVGKSSAAQIPAQEVAAQAPAPSAKPVTTTVQPTGSGAHKIDPTLSEAPLFGTPEKGRLYIQIASVERGFATLMVHGVRNLGFPAFVGEGSTPSVYRVLSGPFADKEAYEKAKATFQAAGLDIFARKYTAEEQKEAVTAPPTIDEPAQP